MQGLEDYSGDTEPESDHEDEGQTGNSDDLFYNLAKSNSIRRGSASISKASEEINERRAVSMRGNVRLLT